MNYEISIDAARAVQSTQRKGYRGIALLSDPPTGQLVLFRVQATGCDSLGTAPILDTDAPAGVMELPDLVVEPETTPADAFRAAEAEIRRLTALMLN